MVVIWSKTQNEHWIVEFRTLDSKFGNDASFTILQGGGGKCV